MSDAPYELVLTPPAIRPVRSGLPEGVAAAVIEFLTGALVENPYRVGKQLRGGLAGIHSARRGTYRCLYRSTRSSAKLWSSASNTDEPFTDPDERLCALIMRIPAASRPGGHDGDLHQRELGR